MDMKICYCPAQPRERYSAAGPSFSDGILTSTFTQPSLQLLEFCPSPFWGLLP